VKIRTAVAGDRDFILGLAERLVEFGDVPGRDRAAMIARDRSVLAAALTGGASTIFVAVDADGRSLGFIHLTTADDYYDAQETAHVADLVVAREAAGRGVGSALMQHAERWAREQGFAMLTLNVFTANQRARDLYTRLGFAEEWIRCFKRL
jgi:ribosomal protein S18 acetylase RimI-like enzyme